MRSRIRFKKLSKATLIITIVVMTAVLFYPILPLFSRDERSDSRYNAVGCFCWAEVTDTLEFGEATVGKSVVNRANAVSEMRRAVGSG